MKIKHNRMEGSLFSSIKLFKYLLKRENKADISAAAQTWTKTSPVKPRDFLGYAADLHSWAAKYTPDVKLSGEAITLRWSQALPASALSHTRANTTLSGRQKLYCTAACSSAQMRTLWSQSRRMAENSKWDRVKKIQGQINLMMSLDDHVIEFMGILIMGEISTHMILPDSFIIKVRGKDPSVTQWVSKISFKQIQD